MCVGGILAYAEAGIERILSEAMLMNWDQVEGKWDQVKGQIKEKWGKLTDNDLTTMAGKKDQLMGKIRERYGYDKQRVENELDTFVKDLNGPAHQESKDL